jgi:hypothetical protein
MIEFWCGVDYQSPEGRAVWFRLTEDVANAERAVVAAITSAEKRVADENFEQALTRLSDWIVRGLPPR